MTRTEDPGPTFAADVAFLSAHLPDLVVLRRGDARVDEENLAFAVAIISVHRLAEHWQGESLVAVLDGAGQPRTLTDVSR